MRFRITAPQHVRKAREFEAVRKTGRVFQYAGFVFTLLKQNETPDTEPVRRLGVIASRRVGNAVVRNRCKRICRELFRKHQHSLPPSCDCVFVVRAKFPELSFNELEQKLIQAVNYTTYSKNNS